MSEEQSRYRKLTGFPSIVTGALLAALPVYSFLFLLRIPDLLFHINLFTGQFLGGFLAILLALVFLVVPQHKNASRKYLPWYDTILALAGFAGGSYIFFFYPAISQQRMYQATFLEIVLGVVTVLLILEALRRLTGWLLIILSGFFIVHALFGDYFPGFLFNRGFSLKRFIELTYFYYDGIFGVALAVAANIIIIYIFFGTLLQITGGGRIFTDIALSMVGKFRGGPAKVAIVASAFFGTISGSPTANVATTGMMTIPMMKSMGYKPHFAGAVEAVSSTGGQIMPPVMGSVAFLMAEYLNVSYGEIIVAALIPALLYFLAVFIQVDLEAAKMGLKGLPAEEIPSGRNALKQSWLVFGPLAVLVIFLIVFHQNASLSGLYALATLFILSFLKKESRLNPRKLLDSFKNTGMGMIDIGIICAMAGIIIGSVTLTGLGFKLSYELVNLAGKNIYILLLITALASTVLGMGLPVVTCYILLVVLVAPALVNLGITPIAAHMFVFYFGVLSFITPPIAAAAYVAAGIARTGFMSVGWKAMQLGIVAYIVPFFFVLNQNLLMKGSAGDILIVFITACIGVAFLSVGIGGYFIRHIGRFSRILFTIGGLGMMFPGWQSDLLGLLPVILEWKLLLKVISFLIHRKRPGTGSTKG
ncbi:MAG: TRAP transporter permease [Dehalococcoidia bacterium]|nr:TRAP transporter permease [Dehalococcoidia bacterium]